MRFRQYVYSQSVVLESDYKPLVGLNDKPIAWCSPRIQRLRMQLQRFYFQLTNQPGKELFIADTLSRAPSSRLFLDDSTQDCEDQVHFVLDRVIPSVNARARYSRLLTKSGSDALPRVGRLSRRWPDHKRSCPIKAKPFWSVCQQLAAADGLLLYGERLVVPLMLRQEDDSWHSRRQFWRV